MSKPVPAQVKSGKITAAVLNELRQLAVPGVTGQELDATAERRIRELGGVPAFLGHQGFPGSLCVSINDQVVHGVPTDRAFADGDLVSLDLGVKVDGYYTDAAITLGVGKLSPEARHLQDITEQSLEIALREARAGRTTGDLGAAVQAFIEAASLAVIRDCVGHGIGKKLHQEPSIPNFGRAGEGATFKAGMAVAIEPMVVIGDPALKLAEDKWTLSSADGSLAAHVEETVLITDGAPLRLTPLHRFDGGLSSQKADGRLGKVA